MCNCVHILLLDSASLALLGFLKHAPTLHVGWFHTEKITAAAAPAWFETFTPPSLFTSPSVQPCQRQSRTVVEMV